MHTLPIDIGEELMPTEDRAERSRLRFLATIKRLTVIRKGRFSQIAIALHRPKLLDHGEPHFQQPIERATFQVAQCNRILRSRSHSAIAFFAAACANSPSSCANSINRQIN